MFGMPTRPRRSLEQSLRDLERTDPRVAASSKRLDDAIDHLNYRASVDDDVAKAKRAAVLVQIREAMEQCDQPKTDSLIIFAQTRGHKLEQADFDLIFTNLSPSAQAFWLGECQCGGGEHAHHARNVN